MKKKIFLLLWCTLVVLWSKHATPEIELKGTFKAPCTITEVPSFTILYQGAQTRSCLNGFFSLKTDHPAPSDPFGILFTTAVTPHQEKRNTFHHLVTASSPYRYFKLALPGSSQYEEQTLEDGNIPKNTIIILIDPDLYIAGLEATQAPSNEKTFSLPTIILKDLDKTTLTHASNKSSCCALKVSSLHESKPVRKKLMPSGNGYISLPH